MSENTTWPRTSGLAAPQTPPERPQPKVPEAAAGEGELQGIRAPSNPGCSPNQQALGFWQVPGCGKVDNVRKGKVAGSRGTSGGCRRDVMSTAWHGDPQESGRVGTNSLGYKSKLVSCQLGANKPQIFFVLAIRCFPKLK